MPKKKTYRATKEITKVRNQLKSLYENKYYDLFFALLKIDGLEEEERHYLLKQLWIDGTVAMTPIPFADKLVFAPWALRRYNLYGDPAEINLINEFQSPLIPAKEMIVDKDAVIIWALSGKNSVRDIINKYIERIINVEMVINTNLTAHKMPLLVGVSPEDIDKANDIIQRLLADEPVIFADLDDLNLVKNVVSESPYIIDKLYQYKCALEGELQTFLGVDNIGVITHTERALVDEVNSGNVITNAMLNSLIHNLQVGFDKAAALWPNIPAVKVSSAIEKSESVKEAKAEGGKDDDVR